MPQSSALPPTARRGIDHDPLLDLPLPRLLAEYGVELVESSITDRKFFGYFLERNDGHRILAMPRGRSAFERDTVARMLLADGLGLRSPRPADSLELSRV